MFQVFKLDSPDDFWIELVLVSKAVDEALLRNVRSDLLVAVELVLHHIHCLFGGLVIPFKAHNQLLL